MKYTTRLSVLSPLAHSGQNAFGFGLHASQDLLEVAKYKKPSYTLTFGIFPSNFGSNILRLHLHSRAGSCVNLVRELNTSSLKLLDSRCSS